MKSNYRKIGEYIKEVNERNNDLAISKLIGVSMEKTFISSVANIVDTDMSVYKILRKGQFACKLMSVGRDEKLPVDLYRDDEPAIVSSAYYVFESKDENILLSEYLFMWLCRPENDRYIGYISGGDVRGGISWDTFCDIPINVPHPDKQKEIVREYNTIVNSIALNNQLIQKLEETARAIYKQWFVDFEFPDENGKPYKSNGGEMVMNEELEKEIPIGWKNISVKDFCIDMKSGGTPGRDELEYWNSNDIPWLKTGEISNKVIVKSEEYISQKGCQNSSAKLLPENTILIAMYGEGKTKGQAGYLRIKASTNQACCAMICDNEQLSNFLYYYLRCNQMQIANMANGGAQPNLSKELIENIKIIKPRNLVVEQHPLIHFINQSEFFERENICFEKIQELLLSKLATIEN